MKNRNSLSLQTSAEGTCAFIFKRSGLTYVRDVTPASLDRVNTLTLLAGRNLSVVVWIDPEDNQVNIDIRRR